MASKSNLSPSNQTPQLSQEQLTISQYEENPQEKEKEKDVCLTDSDSDSSLHGSNPGFKVHSITPATRRGGSRKGNSSKKRKTTQRSSNVAFKRKWELEDEIVVLKEMCEIKTLDGKIDEKCLFDSLKGKLKGEYSFDQLKNKMRNMRTKYGMCIKDGDFASLDDHEALVFGLSEKVWGDVVLRTRARETDANGNGVGGENVVSVGDGVSKVDENGVENSGGKGIGGNEARESVETENGVGGNKRGRKNVKSVGNGAGESEAENGVGGKKRRVGKSAGTGAGKSVEAENGVGGKKRRGGKIVKSVGNGARETVATESVDDGTKDGVNVAKTDQNVIEKEVIGEGNFVRSFKRLCKSSVKLMKKNLKLIGNAKGNELGDEWMLLMEEMELNNKKAIVRMKQIELVYDHIKES